MGREGRIDEKRLFTRFGMGSNDGMGVARIYPMLDDGVTALGAITVIRRTVMGRRQVAEISFHRFRQRVIGGAHAGEQGVPARWRNFNQS